MVALHRLTDAEWAVVEPAVVKAQEAQAAVNRLVALYAVWLGQEPSAVVLRGREIYGPEPVAPDSMREDA